jgi:hypothetical protein
MVCPIPNPTIGTTLLYRINAPFENISEPAVTLAKPAHPTVPTGGAGTAA